MDPEAMTLTGREVISIVNQRVVKVDGKVRTDATYPAGVMGEVLWTLRPPIREH
jgi:ribosomal protein S4E